MTQLLPTLACWLGAASLLAGCASAPEPVTLPRPPAIEFALSPLRTELNSPQMQRFREQDQAREAADLACLTPEQRKDFTDRRNTEVKRIYDESTALWLQAVRDKDPAVRKKRAAAQQALNRCEAE